MYKTVPVTVVSGRIIPYTNGGGNIVVLRLAPVLGGEVHRELGLEARFFADENGKLRSFIRRSYQDQEGNWRSASTPIESRYSLIGEDGKPIEAVSGKVNEFIDLCQKFVTLNWDNMSRVTRAAASEEPHPSTNIDEANDALAEAG